MNAKEFAPIVLRIGLALVLLWFGISQLVMPDNWVGWLPSWLPSFGLEPTTHVFINGGIETLLALSILAGLFTRAAATLAAVHMLAVVIAVVSVSGFDATAVRDVGVFVGIVAVALYGSDVWSLDTKRKAA